MSEHLITVLEAVSAPKTKLTILVVGGGMMGCDVRSEIVSRGWIGTPGEALGFSYPRKRKILNFTTLLRRAPVIVLRGHETSRPVFESHMPARDGVTSFMLTGTGGRFVDADGGGAAALIEYLKKYLVLHTFRACHPAELYEAYATDKNSQRRVVDPDFKRKLLEGLGPAIDMDPAAPVVPERKPLLTDAMKAQLRELDGQSPPKVLYKLFSPEGAATWLLCSLAPDGDTLWAVCDLGLGYVEYGTVSLAELETLVTPKFKLHVELDRHFDGSKLDVGELLRRDRVGV